MPISTSSRCLLMFVCVLLGTASCSRSKGGGECDGNDNNSSASSQNAGDCVTPPIIIDDDLLGPAVDEKITVKRSEPFSKFQLANLLYTNNVYDGRARLPGNPNQLYYSAGVQDFVEWTVPSAEFLDESRNSCGLPQGNDDVSLEYRITSHKDAPDRFYFVRAFPAMVVGTMGGRYETWGVECGESSVISDKYGRLNSPAYDMTQSNKLSGFPTLVSELPADVRISVKTDINSGSASNGIANVFLDTYWHDVSSVEKLPGQDSQWKDTINGINSDYTETWNLNIWLDWTNINDRNLEDWTGGIPLATVQITDNPEFDVYLKAEGSRNDYLPTCRTGDQNNCFLYIALAVTDRQLTADGVTINYTEIASWMRSAEFRDLFLKGATIQGTNDPSAIAYEIWRTIDGPENDSHPDAAKRGPRFPDLDYVIGGLHLGSEIWFNPQGDPATLDFETFGVKVNGYGTFGRYVNYNQP